ncbi:MAG: hypothetical protein ACTHJT_09500 [Cytophaga sp.]|uniref:hypothetical protein n=1 Tax=Cytophaga sp. TaxID=29535 RepID=UPI003F7CDF98
MKTQKSIKKITAAFVAVSMMFIVFGSQAASLSIQNHKKNHTEEFHKALEEKGYTHMTQFSVSKSDIHQSRYFVNFVNDGKIYDAYFTAKGELIEVYEVAQM